VSEKSLELPFIASIPYRVQADENISDASKLYFGQIVGLSVKYGYIFATDDQLAEMKKTSKKNIERWNKELEDAGYIKRITENIPKRNLNGELHWIKSRKIFVYESFSKKDCGTLKNEGTNEPLKNEGTNEPLKNEGITNNLKDSTSKLQPDPLVVIFSSLENLDIEDNLKKKISNEHSQQEVDLAVKRCLNWKTRPNDEAGVLTALKRADSWTDVKTPEEKSDTNLEYLKTLAHLDGSKIGIMQITIGNKYIEFISGPKIVHFNIDDDGFKKSVIDYFEYLNKLFRNKE
jgi:hypothetical protein